MARIARKETALFDWLPDIDGIGCSLKLLEGQYVEFSYETQLEASQSPSAVAARANTVYAAENPDTVKGFLTSGSLFLAKSTGHFCVRLRSICRKDAWKLLVMRDGKWAEADSITTVSNKGDARMFFKARNPRLRRLREDLDWKITGGEHQFRTFRLCGIRSHTLKCSVGPSGKRPVFACGVGVAEVL